MITMPMSPFCDQLQLDHPGHSQLDKTSGPTVARLQAGEHPVSWPGMRTAQTRQPGSSWPQKCELGVISRTREVKRDRKEQLSQIMGGRKTGDDPSPGTEGKSWFFRLLTKST